MPICKYTNNVDAFAKQQHAIKFRRNENGALAEDVVVLSDRVVTLTILINHILFDRPRFAIAYSSWQIFGECCVHWQTNHVICHNICRRVRTD